MHHAASIQLDDEERAMLEGARGQAVQEAIRFQIEVGNFFEARRFVKVNHAHVMGDIEVMGDGGLGLLREMDRQGGRCAVPTSSNAHCMHFHPAPALRQDPQEEAKEREILTDAARKEGKPENIIAKMIEGRLRNFFSQCVLLEQPFVKDDKQSVKQFIGNADIVRYAQVEIG